MQLLLALVLLACPNLGLMTAAGEPGTPLVVHGQVFAPDGKTPAAGVTLYAYQTDARGLYHAPGVKEPRLRATCITDAQGRFELRTIRPGAYPGGGIPAHIHFQAWGGGYPKQWLPELQFDDDASVTAALRAESRARGKFANIVAAPRDAHGVLHATMKLVLRPASNF
jgi:protocatechuate 3,4-dioxygenase beta subunit